MAILESDAFAIAMLVVIFSGFGVLGVLLLSMRRHVARRDPAVDQLLDELAADEREKLVSVTASVPAHPWEKEADWWKEDGADRRKS